MKAIDPRFNKEQLQAIGIVQGNLLIIASAGTGKTSTIVERYANMIGNHEYRPSEILMTTFTNKAAADMMNKIYLRTKTKPPYVGTMHSLFLKILRSNALRVLPTEDFTIIEDADKKRIVRDILKKEKIDTKADNMKYFISWIGKFKNSGIYSEILSAERTLDYMIEDGIVEEVLDDELIRINPALRRYVNKVYKKYDEALRLRGMIDLDDILLLTLKLLEKNEDIREEYRNKFKAIMVDEAQDLNVVQMKILNLLQNDNLCLIGDDCQNIYEWRGSSNELVFQFNDSKNKVTLKENYRSSKKIIDSVNKIIGSISTKIDKELVCTKNDSGHVSFESFSDGDEEIEYVTYRIKELIAQGVKKDQIAVLFRINRIGKDIERTLLREGVPCHLSRSRDFFEREEVKDLLSFLKLKVNPRAIIDFNRIAQWVEGIGQVSVKKMENLSLKKGISLVDVLDYGAELKFTENTCAELKRLKEALQSYRADPVNIFLDDFGYQGKLAHKYHKQENLIKEKLKNIEVLEELYKEYPCNVEGVKSFLDSLLDLEKKEKAKDKVILTTIHGAKGLEWEHVFLISCNEKIIPYYTKHLTPAKRDSELRLFYVAVSRAKKALIVTNNEYNLFGKECERSSFVDIIE